MATFHSHYEKLNVSANATDDEINDAYDLLLKKYNPENFEVDKKEQASRIIESIRKSYEVLIDPIQRTEHDTWIHLQENGNNSTSEIISKTIEKTVEEIKNIGDKVDVDAIKNKFQNLKDKINDGANEAKEKIKTTKEKMDLDAEIKKSKKILENEELAKNKQIEEKPKVGFFKKLLTPKPEKTPEELRKDIRLKVTKEHDKFTNVTTFSTPEFKATFFDKFTSYIRALKIYSKQHDTYEIIYQILITSRLDDWMFCNSAFDEDSNQLETKILRSETDNSKGAAFIESQKYVVVCVEIVSVTLTSEYMENHAISGTTIQIRGEKYKQIINIPAMYIGGLLDAVNQHD